MRRIITPFTGRPGTQKQRYPLGSHYIKLKMILPGFSTRRKAAVPPFPYTISSTLMPSLPKNNPKCGASLCLITCMLYSGLPVSSQLIAPKVSFAGCSSLPVSTWNVFRDLRVGNVKFCVQVRLNPVLKKSLPGFKKTLRRTREKTSMF